jgi:hypothetical protein
VDIFLAAAIAMAEPVESHFIWRPRLRDPNDELVLEAAANGGAAAIVTFNKRVFWNDAATVRCRRVDAARGFGKDRAMRSTPSACPLRLSHSIKAEVERVAKSDGIGINQFAATAVAEKLSAMNTAAFFAERRAKADFAAFDRILGRAGGVAPAAEDNVD